MSKKVAFLVPVCSKHFDYARDFIKSFNEHNLNEQSDIWFIFSDETDKIAFCDHNYAIILPENLRIYENRGIINIKKFYGLRQIQEKYEYVIILDAESLFLKNASLFDICEEYFASKILLGNEIFQDEIELIENIKNSCKRFFAWHKDFDKLNIRLYLWQNNLQIYKTSTLSDFWNKIDYDNNITKLKWEDFDYYIYMFYLILFHEFKIEDIEIRSNCGVFETTNDFLFFKSNKYERLPIYMASKYVMKKLNNQKSFILINRDRKNK